MFADRHITHAFAESSAMEHAMKNEILAQETFNLLALASKELPLARLKAKDRGSDTLDLETISEFLDHPNPNLSLFAGELVLLHFPGKARYSTIAKLMISGNRTTSDLATEFAVKHFPEQLDIAVVRVLARKHRLLDVRAAAREYLDAVAERQFFQYVERNRRS